MSALPDGHGVDGGDVPKTTPFQVLDMECVAALDDRYLLTLVRSLRDFSINPHESEAPSLLTRRR